MAARGMNVRESKQPREIYQDALDNVSAFNARLCFERKMRAPFLDAQTGIAMNNCHLWLSRFMRREPKTPQYVYTYPPRRWRKRKRVHRVEPAEEEESSHVADEAEASPSHGDGESDQAVSHTGAAPSESGKDDIKDEESFIMEDSEAEEEPEDSNVVSDEEEFEYKKKRGRPGRKKGSTVSTNTVKTFPRHSFNQAGSVGSSYIVKNITKEELSRMNPDDRKKPYACEICGRRYKNGPGLKYHYTHYNHDLDNQEDSHSSAPPSAPASVVDSPKPASPVLKIVPQPRRLDGTAATTATPNSYCDFCLGDKFENKKTGRSEELLSCADCGRSGHPSCLQFTARLTDNVKKYRWQCIECKSCSLCGTSDNDDQLLFCDDCDRGYHMYCLKPPMDAPPEGHWMCNLCRASLVIQPVATGLHAGHP